MTNVVTHYGEEESKQESTILLDENNLRTDQHKGAAEGTSTIFHKNEEVLYTIDHDDKTYTEINKEDIEQLEKQMKQMQKRMESMPKEQREQMKEMMGDKMGKMAGTEQEDITYKKTGNSKEVAPWGTCQEYKGMNEEGDMVQKVYVTERKNVKVEKEHFDILTDMLDFLNFMPEDMDKYYPVKSEKKEEGALPGFGVLWIYYDDDGNKTQKMRVKEMKKTEIPESRFEVPSDYEGSSMKTGAGGRR